MGIHATTNHQLLVNLLLHCTHLQSRQTVYSTVLSSTYAYLTYLGTFREVKLKLSEEPRLAPQHEFVHSLPQSVYPTHPTYALHTN